MLTSSYLLTVNSLAKLVLAFLDMRLYRDLLPIVNILVLLPKLEFQTARSIALAIAFFAGTSCWGSNVRSCRAAVGLEFVLPWNSAI